MRWTEAEIEAAAPEMSVEAFLALPDDGIDRELIRGRLRQYGMTYRNRLHAHAEANCVFFLRLWLNDQPEPRGWIVSGEAGFRLRGAVDSIVAVDVAYVSAERLAATDANAKVIDGPPILAVEVRSGSETVDDLYEKVAAYREVGTIVWEVDPRYRTVLVHRTGRPPVLFNETQELTGDPELPGFRVAVARLFE